MNISEIIKKQIDLTIKNTDYNIGSKYKGKVRDVYDLGDHLLIIATDRISAFDRVLSFIPFKGEVLTNLSMFWFENTKDILQNHIVKQVHPNAVLVKKCKILPVEVIIRGYLTGGGWREYIKTGMISGVKLSKDLKKDSKFEKPVFTPTTKAQTGHDESITRDEIIKRNIIDKNLLDKIESYALKLFERGTELAKKNNLILVDTKYEFGLLNDGSLIVADEIHTSDSSRYWYLDTYDELYKSGKEQRMLDKEYFRQWLLSKNYQGEGNPPEIPYEIIEGVCKRYLEAYKTITGTEYKLVNKDPLIDLDKAVSELKEGLNIK
ncbi:MAG: phosphoribosylaminoimidazolesuccinocarboxamide synthase [Spirochaetes bacterium]|nr:phosphoribosylaminoimidazolesuccinocarboxamide synthase [Spirochaetota bacterium]